MSEERTPYYNIQLKINEKDITQFVTNITYINNINFIYPVFTINLSVSSSFPELQFIYERSKLRLIIEYTTENRVPMERFEFLLMIVSINSTISLTSDKIMADHPTRGSVILQCVPQDELILSSTLINYISRIRDLDSPIEALEKIILGFFEKDKIEINFDKENRNKYIPEEIFVPIMNFSRVITYLDNNYGLYKGAPYFNMSFDATTGKIFFNMYDLALKFDPRINEDFKIIFISLGSGKNLEKAYKDAGVSDNIYYTRENLKKTHTQLLYKNSNVVYYRALIKDSYSLCEEKVIKNSECLKNAIPNFNGELIQINSDIPLLEKRLIFNTDKENADLINSSIFKRLIDRVEYLVSFDRNIKLKNILKVGLSVKLEFLKEEEVIYGGRYITKGTRVKLDRKRPGYFFGTADLIICRPHDIENVDLEDTAEKCSDEDVKIEEY